jgi:hypothetical protein
VAIVLFWIVFGLENEELPSHVVDFEFNFFIPDLLWITPLLILSSYWLKHDHSYGVIAGVAAGGGLVFLVLLDAMFNIRHGGYSLSADGLLNVAVNSGCIGFGIWSLVLLERFLRTTEWKD